MSSEQLKTCQWNLCQEIATVRMVASDTNLCDEHKIANIIQFGCNFKFEDLNTRTQKDQS